MEKILSGEKDVEYKGCTPHWVKRLSKYVGRFFLPIEITFICGRKVYKYNVISIWWHSHKDGFLIDGKLFHEYFTIYLGERIS